MTLLGNVVDQTPLPTATDLAPARQRLMAALTAEQPRKSRKRLILSGATVVGLAAAITGVVAFGGFGVAPPEADAVEFLHRAADVVRELPATPPRPDQFVYTRGETTDGAREAWLSADGEHDGMIRAQGEDTPLPGCKDGRRRVMRGDVDMGMTEPCDVWPAYRRLPTDTAGMRAYLEGTPNDFDILLHFAIQETYVSPQAMAALFEVMADFPGLEIVEDATDGAGRHGVGLTWAQPADQNEVTLVFDQETHVFLGTEDTAVFVHAIVDAVGQRP
ncbi:CU044_5270 family protein [Actinophytocola algeriensis]|nr:CU044_5270 family protein [Actinophytocola algeriensis]